MSENIQVILTKQEIETVIKALKAVAYMKNALGLEVDKCDHDEITENFVVQLSRHYRGCKQK